MTVQAPETNGQTWSMQAAAEREHGIALLLEARQRVRELRISLDDYDRQLSYRLCEYQKELDTRLGALLVAREDQADQPVPFSLTDLGREAS